MKEKLVALYNHLKEQGLTPERERKILVELHDEGTHDLPDEGLSADDSGPATAPRPAKSFYAYSDIFDLQAITALETTHTSQPLCTEASVMSSPNFKARS